MKAEHNIPKDVVRRMTDYELDYWMRPADQKMRRELESAEARCEKVEAMMKAEGIL